MRAIIIYGPPGAGKGTQANLIADKFGYIHFDTGKYLESVITDPANKDNQIIQREKELFDKGELLTSAWVLQVISDETRRIGAAGIGLVFSGSPRTMYEAFGDELHDGLTKELVGYYSKENIFVFYLKSSPEVSLYRNSRRLVCSICGRPVLYFDHEAPPQCGFCGGPLRKRSLDKPEIIKDRLKVFERDTLPIIDEFRKRGYNVVEVNGERKSFEVFQEIVEKLS